MSTFLSDFDTVVQGTESPRSYGVYAGLVTLSSIVSRRVWLPMGHYNIFPNLYVVFVGPPGFRKTTAMDIGKGLIRRYNKAHMVSEEEAVLGGAKDIPMSAECITAEKLIQDMQVTKRPIEGLDPQWENMAVYSPMTVMVTELSELLKIGGPAMISFLTAIYDRDVYDYRTKNRGQEYVEGPFLNLAACTTPDWINTYLKDDVISGGFSRRALFVYETEEGKRIAIPEVTDEIREAWKRMEAFADKAQHIKGPMKLSDEARDYYVQWYETYKIPSNRNVAGYYRSKHVQMFKLAMLISLAESPTKLITLEHVKSAFAMLEVMERNLASVFAGMGQNSLHQVAHQVVELLKGVPEQEFMIGNQKTKIRALAESQLRMQMFQNTNRVGIEEVISHLHETGRIRKLHATKGAFSMVIIALKEDKE